MASYIRGRLNVACNKLIDELAEMGIAAAVGHFGRASKGLIVRPQKRSDAPRIPGEFGGLKVAVEFTDDNGDPLVEPSPLVKQIRKIMLDQGLAINAIAAVVKIVESWENDPAEWTSAHHGFLLVGVDTELRNVVIDLGQDRTGHINFTSDEAIGLANLLLAKANELDATI